MIILIKTTADNIEYGIKDPEGSTNDEICRAIAHLDIIKDELKNLIDFDYEIFKNP